MLEKRKKYDFQFFQKSQNFRKWSSRGGANGPQDGPQGDEQMIFHVFSCIFIDFYIFLHELEIVDSGHPSGPCGAPTI